MSTKRNPDRESRTEALEYYEYSAKTGDPAAELLLAQLYYFGMEDREPDFERARVYFERSASKGNEGAMSFLGQMYYRGEGVAIDYARAYDYFVQAAQRDLPAALNGLGLMYWRGQEVAKDLAEAEAYFKRAAELHYPEAHYNYAMVLLEQPSALATEQVFQSIIAAVRNGYVHATPELVKRYLDAEGSCTLAVHVRAFGMARTDFVTVVSPHCAGTTWRGAEALSRGACRVCAGTAGPGAESVHFPCGNGL